uniref:Uncharacterized protein n=1 Tax=Lactuca sativa TaxID=4236 RepID=A0A9R1V014_LACSA|nr:hypothetical protein LSAT_V11C700376900 [Lactuca sativa]
MLLMNTIIQCELSYHGCDPPNQRRPHFTLIGRGPHDPLEAETRLTKQGTKFRYYRDIYSISVMRATIELGLTRSAPHIWIHS